MEDTTLPRHGVAPRSAPELLYHPVSLPSTADQNEKRGTRKLPHRHHDMGQKI